MNAREAIRHRLFEGLEQSRDILPIEVVPENRFLSQVRFCGKTSKGVLVHDHRLHGEDWDSAPVSPNGKYVVIDSLVYSFDPVRDGDIDQATWLKEGDTVDVRGVLPGYKAVHDHRGDSMEGDSCWYRRVPLNKT